MEQGKNIATDTTEPLKEAEPVIDAENKVKKKKKKKKRSKRCATCNKRVGSFGITCRCGNLYCGKHRYASEHNCTWDYKAEQCKIIRDTNPDMSFAKIDTI